MIDKRATPWILHCAKVACNVQALIITQIIWSCFMQGSGWYMSHINYPHCHWNGCTLLVYKEILFTHLNIYTVRNHAHLILVGVLSLFLVSFDFLKPSLISLT